MTNQVYSLNELAAVITPILRKYKAERALLFGSYARQEADADSDIDLLVIGGAQFDPTDVFFIADELYRATGKPVDVYELCEINADTDFYNTIMNEGVQIA